jgi:hypothetical protein
LIKPKLKSTKVHEEIPLVPQTEATTTMTASLRFLHNMARVMDYSEDRRNEEPEALLLDDMKLAYLYLKGVEFIGTFKLALSGNAAFKL